MLSRYSFSYTWTLTLTGFFLFYFAAAFSYPPDYRLILCFHNAELHWTRSNGSSSGWLPTTCRFGGRAGAGDLSVAGILCASVPVAGFRDRAAGLGSDCRRGSPPLGCRDQFPDQERWASRCTSYSLVTSAGRRDWRSCERDTPPPPKAAARITRGNCSILWWRRRTKRRTERRTGRHGGRSLQDPGCRRRKTRPCRSWGKSPLPTIRPWRPGRPGCRTAPLDGLYAGGPRCHSCGRESASR